MACSACSSRSSSRARSARQGTDFHKAYGPHVNQIEQSTKILAEGLASIHEAMSDMADGHIDNEELIRAMFTRIRVERDSTGADSTGHDK